MILEFDSRRAGRARRPQNAIRRAARRLKTTPHGPQERVAGEGAVDADASGGNAAEERVKRDRLVPAKRNQSHRWRGRGTAPRRASGITECAARRGSRAATRSRYRCHRDTFARAYPSPGRRAPLARPEATAARRVGSEGPGRRQYLVRPSGPPSATRGARSERAAPTTSRQRRSPR